MELQGEQRREVGPLLTGVGARDKFGRLHAAALHRLLPVLRIHLRHLADGVRVSAIHLQGGDQLVVAEGHAMQRQMGAQGLELVRLQRAAVPQAPDRLRGVAACKIDLDDGRGLFRRNAGQVGDPANARGQRCAGRASLGRPGAQRTEPGGDAVGSLGGDHVALDGALQATLDGIHGCRKHVRQRGLRRRRQRRPAARGRQRVGHDGGAEDREPELRRQVLGGEALGDRELGQPFPRGASLPGQEDDVPQPVVLFERVERGVLPLGQRGHQPHDAVVLVLAGVGAELDVEGEVARRVEIDVRGVDHGSGGRCDLQHQIGAALLRALELLRAIPDHVLAVRPHQRAAQLLALAQILVIGGDGQAARRGTARGLHEPAHPEALPPVSERDPPAAQHRVHRADRHLIDQQALLGPDARTLLELLDQRRRGGPGVFIAELVSRHVEAERLHCRMEVADSRGALIVLDREDGVDHDLCSLLRQTLARQLSFGTPCPTVAVDPMRL